MGVDVDDLAAAIIERLGAPTSMRLEKLVYYCQAVALARTGRPLFDDRIEAWANGPMVRHLYEQHRAMYTVGSWPSGDPDRLPAEARAVLDETLTLYGGFDGDWLSQQSHIDEPWRRAREGLKPAERSNRPIDLEAMRDYYARVLDDDAVNRAVKDPPGYDEFLDVDQLRAKLQPVL